MRKILHSDKLPGPKFNYSPCVNVGPIYQFAGLVGLDGDTGQLVEGGAAHETQMILENMSNALPDFGLSWNDCYSARLYTTRFDQFQSINEVWSRTFDGSIPPPARSAVGVSALPLGAEVEIEFAFYRS